MLKLFSKLNQIFNDLLSAYIFMTRIVQHILLPVSVRKEKKYKNIEESSQQMLAFRGVES